MNNEPNPDSQDSLAKERIRMENMGRVFIILLFAVLAIAGRFVFGL